MQIRPPSPTLPTNTAETLNALLTEFRRDENYLETSHQQNRALAIFQECLQSPSLSHDDSIALLFLSERIQRASSSTKETLLQTKDKIVQLFEKPNSVSFDEYLETVDLSNPNVLRELAAIYGQLTNQGMTIWLSKAKLGEAFSTFIDAIPQNTPTAVRIDKKTDTESLSASAKEKIEKLCLTTKAFQPASFPNCKTLSVESTSCHITSLLVWMGKNLPQVEHLDISSIKSFQITKTPKHTWPSLSQLKTVDLPINISLTGLLQIFTLCPNLAKGMKALPFSIIESIQLDHLYDILSIFRDLEELDLSQVHIISHDDNFSKSKFSSMRVLRLKMWQVGSTDQLIETMPNLQTVHFTQQTPYPLHLLKYAPKELLQNQEVPAPSLERQPQEAQIPPVEKRPFPTLRLSERPAISLRSLSFNDILDRNLRGESKLFSKEQIQNLPFFAIPFIDPSQIKNVTVDQMKMVTPAQIYALSDEEIGEIGFEKWSSASDQARATLPARYRSFWKLSFKSKVIVTVKSAFKITRGVLFIPLSLLLVFTPIFWRRNSGKYSKAIWNWTSSKVGDIKRFWQGRLKG